MSRVRANPVPGRDALCRKAVGVQPGRGEPRLCLEHPKGDVRVRLVRNGSRVRTDESSCWAADEAEFHDEKDPCWSCGAHGQAVPGCEGYEEAAACSLCVVCLRERIGECELLKSAPTDAWGLRIWVLRDALWELGFEGPPELGVPPWGNFAGSGLRKGCLVGSTEAPLLLDRAHTLSHDHSRTDPNGRPGVWCGSEGHSYRKGNYGHLSATAIPQRCPRKLRGRSRCGRRQAFGRPLSTTCRGFERFHGKIPGVPLERGRKRALAVARGGLDRRMKGLEGSEREGSVGKAGITSYGAEIGKTGSDDVNTGRGEVGSEALEVEGTEDSRAEGMTEEGVREGKLAEASACLAWARIRPRGAGIPSWEAEPERARAQWRLEARSRDLVWRVLQGRAWWYMTKKMTTVANCELGKADVAGGWKQVPLAHMPTGSAELVDPGLRLGPLMDRRQVVRLRARGQRDHLVVIDNVRDRPELSRLKVPPRGGISLVRGA